jgi:hypothetical protein
MTPAGISNNMIVRLRSGVFEGHRSSVRPAVKTGTSIGFYIPTLQFYLMKPYYPNPLVAAFVALDALFNNYTLYQRYFNNCPLIKRPHNVVGMHF